MARRHPFGILPRPRLRCPHHEIPNLAGWRGRPRHRSKAHKQILPALTLSCNRFRSAAELSGRFHRHVSMRSSTSSGTSKSLAARQRPSIPKVSQTVGYAVPDNVQRAWRCPCVGYPPCCGELSARYRQPIRHSSSMTGTRLTSAFTARRLGQSRARYSQGGSGWCKPRSVPRDVRAGLPRLRMADPHACNHR